MKKFKSFLFDPDEYTGLTWFEVLCAWTIGAGIFTMLIFLIKASIAG